ncbi:putative short-chain dehydrogenase [Xylaria curta]|nr:putative short-chain dehydrogenase [Xylaria curta]
MADQKLLALVTGANGGIGFEVVNQLLADGSFHVLLGSRSIEKGEAALADLQSRNLPGTVELVQLDVADEKSIAAAAKVVEEKHGRLDALVNNAGIARGPGTLAEQMVDCFRVSAVGAQLMSDYFSPLLKKSTGTPRIINVTSGAGSIGNHIAKNNFGLKDQVIPYRVCKAAMNMVFACQVRSYEEEGFKIFLYGPGPTVSNLSPPDFFPGKKPTAVGAAPITEMVQGKRDEDAGIYLEYGYQGAFPW